MFVYMVIWIERLAMIQCFQTKIRHVFPYFQTLVIKYPKPPFLILLSNPPIFEASPSLFSLHTDSICKSAGDSSHEGFRSHSISRSFTFRSQDGVRCEQEEGASEEGSRRCKERR
ncbi:hypothetical protein L1987_81861 [Smallanthus sonchifolius]|uniref:Uncharacterized protein n=1 Tax=Smallanthus sonchifolius TaxID=185202 RepID=A0ACB8YS93_9ASTR|nr:hypothetical protein L1987_81861 [Smallanthus sonchifolius]